MKFKSGARLMSDEAEVDNVRAFFTELLNTGFNFHPDTSGREYITGLSGPRSFTDEEADEYDELMARAFEVCDRDCEDVYGTAFECFRLYEMPRLRHGWPEPLCDNPAAEGD